jgi:hypothetical protein
VLYEESGVYRISDLFGGYYAIGRNYGSDYATGGAIKVNLNTGKVSLVSSDVTPWLDKFSNVAGTYDSQTQTFEIDVTWEAGYVFHLIFTKQ